MNNQGVELAKTARIIITVSKMGSGTETDPIKKIVQCWTLDGKLITTVDYSKELMESLILSFGN